MAASSGAVFFVFASLPAPRYHTQRDNVQPNELRWEVAVGMRKADDALVAAVNTALTHMLADGTVRRIYARYGIDQGLPTPPD